jgi:hypothetical protein
MPVQALDQRSHGSLQAVQSLGVSQFRLPGHLSPSPQARLE